MSTTTTNVFATIALSDALAARILAHAFTAAHEDMYEVFAALRFARATMGIDGNAYLYGRAFSDLFGCSFSQDPVDTLRYNPEAFSEVREMAWDYLASIEAAA